jgi:Subtilase family
MSVLALSAAFAAPAHAAPLVPRELASLASHRHTLVQLDRERGVAARRALQAAGGVLVSSRLRVWRIPSPVAARLVPRLAVAGALSEFEPDVTRPVANHGIGGDPLLAEQYWLSRVGADRAYAPGPGKPVTVVDTGIDLTHPEFAGRPHTFALNPQRLVRSRDFHGTAVASVVAAPANGVGVVGVYPQAVLRSWDASPNGVLRSSQVIAGISAAASQGPGVITLSVGGFSRSRLEQQAILDAVARGSIVVAAVGNERQAGSPIAYPANLPHVLTVASTDAFDEVSVFSSEATGIDLAAPGEDIPLAIPTSYEISGYSSETGTSFAAPIVAGAVAWIWTARPQLDNTQVLELMRRSARDLAPAGRDRDTGFGLLDIQAALTRPAPAPDPLEPNDDVEQVRPNGLFAQGKRPLTDPFRTRAALTARVDVIDDPRDVYRVWVPAQRRVTATLRSARGVELQPLGTRPRGVVAEAAGRTTARRTVTLTNRSRTGVFLYLSAFIRLSTGFPDATYSLTVSSPRAPR